MVILHFTMFVISRRRDPTWHFGSHDPVDHLISHIICQSTIAFVHRPWGCFKWDFRGTCMGLSWDLKGGIPFGKFSHIELENHHAINKKTHDFCRLGHAINSKLVVITRGKIPLLVYISFPSYAHDFYWPFSIANCSNEIMADPQVTRGFNSGPS